MSEQLLLDGLRGSWSWFVLRGVAAIVFAALAFAWPGLTLVVLALFWGAYALADGVFALIAAFRMRDGGKPIWTWILVGLLGIAAGIVTFAWPGMTALLLLMFIAAWAIVIGALQIIVAIRIRKEIDNEWMLIASGVLSMAFGVLMVASPGAGALAVVYVIAAYTALFGVLLLALGLRLRKAAPRQPQSRAAA